MLAAGRRLFSGVTEFLSRRALLVTSVAQTAQRARISFEEANEVRTNLDILAVTSKDLRALLTEWDLDKLVDNGDLRCPETGQRITWDNIGTIRVEDGKPVLYSVDAQQ